MGKRGLEGLWGMEWIGIEKVNIEGVEEDEDCALGRKMDTVFRLYSIFISLPKILSTILLLQLENLIST
jgi:hypothetical protein